MADPTLEHDDLRNYFLSPFGPKPVGKITDSKTLGYYPNKVACRRQPPTL